VIARVAIMKKQCLDEQLVVQLEELLNILGSLKVLR